MTPLIRAANLTRACIRVDIMSKTVIVGEHKFLGTDPAGKQTESIHVREIASDVLESQAHLRSTMQVSSLCVAQVCTACNWQRTMIVEPCEP